MHTNSTMISPSSDDRDVAFAEEEVKLTEVLRAIEDNLQAIKDQSPAMATHQETADLAQKSLDETGGDLKDVLAQPYFGRLAYLTVDAPRQVRDENGDEVGNKRIYIGSAFVHGQAV